jgi:hypothetical protein
MSKKTFDAKDWEKMADHYVSVGEDILPKFDAVNHVMQNVGVLDREERVKFIGRMLMHGLIDDKIINEGKAYAIGQRQREEKLQERLNQKAEAQKAENARFENMFPMAFRARRGNAIRLREVVEKATTEDLEKTLQALKTTTTPSIYGYEVGEAMTVLENELTKRAIAEAKKPGLLHRLLQ